MHAVWRRVPCWKTEASGLRHALAQHLTPLRGRPPAERRRRWRGKEPKSPALGPKLEARTSFYGTEDPSCRAVPREGPGSNPEQPTGWERAYLRVRKTTETPQ